jgi:hypothetical protein
MKASPRKKNYQNHAPNVLTAKSAKIPISFIKDSKLLNYSPRKENMVDFLPGNATGASLEG